MIINLTIFFALLAIVCSFCVITVRNPIHSILYLILVFCNISFILIIWNVEFIAIIFLIVYVGAIAVLFLFVVMMLNIKIIELNEVFWRYIPIGFLISCIFILEIYLVLFNNNIFCQILSYMSIDNINYFFKHVINESYVYNISLLGFGKMGSLSTTLSSHKLLTIKSSLLFFNSYDLFLNNYYNNIKLLNSKDLFFLCVVRNLHLTDFFNSVIYLPEILHNSFVSFKTPQNFSSLSFFNNLYSSGDGMHTYIILNLSTDFLYNNIFYWYNTNETKTNTEILGWFIYTYSFFLFFIIGLILLLAMIGSIVLILNQNINVKRQYIFQQVSRNLHNSIKLKN